MKGKVVFIILCLFALSINFSNAQTSEAFTEWQSFGNNLFIRVKVIGKEALKGRSMVLLKVQLKQNVNILDAENSNFGNYRVILSRMIAGPSDNPYDMPQFGIEFSRSTEEIYEIPETVYYPETVDNGEMKGQFNPETGLVDYTPNHQPDKQYSSPMYLYKHCEDQAFKGTYFSCKGVEFARAKGN